jgi:hypothetical protein
VGQSMDWFDFMVPSLTTLINEVIDIVCLTPSP